MHFGVHTWGSDIYTVLSNKKFWRTLHVLCNAFPKPVYLLSCCLHSITQGVLREYDFLFLGDKRKLNIFI